MKNAGMLRQCRSSLQLGAVIRMFLLTLVAVNVQQTTGVPCSPSATTTVDGKYIPPPPNVLLIMTDDQEKLKAAAQHLWVLHSRSGGIISGQLRIGWTTAPLDNLCRILQGSHAKHGGW